MGVDLASHWRIRGASVSARSLGGAAVLSGAREIPKVRAVATIGAPAEPAHVRRLLGTAAKTIQREGRGTIVLAGRRFHISRPFLEDLEQQNLARHVSQLGRALLVMHAPGDEIVGLDNARAIYEAARHPKSFVSLDGADHVLSRREDGEYAARALAAWASRCVHPAQAPVAPRSSCRTKSQLGNALVGTGRGRLTMRPREAGRPRDARWMSEGDGIRADRRTRHDR